MKSYLSAFLVAPLVVPVLYWAGLLLQALADPNRRRVALQAPFAGLGYVLAIGTPIAYAATLVPVVPAIWLVRHAGRWALGGLLVLGGTVGLVATLVLSPYLRGDLFSVILSPLGGAALGALSAGVFWQLAPHRGRTETGGA
jgi:hypothetical protein